VPVQGSAGTSASTTSKMRGQRQTSPSSKKAPAGFSLWMCQRLGNELRSWCLHRGFAATTYGRVGPKEKRTAREKNPAHRAGQSPALKPPKRG
jgi:hypothetical protein